MDKSKREELAEQTQWSSVNLAKGIQALTGRFPAAQRPKDIQSLIAVISATVNILGECSKYLDTNGRDTDRLNVLQQIKDEGKLCEDTDDSLLRDWADHLIYQQQKTER